MHVAAHFGLVSISVASILFLSSCSGGGSSDGASSSNPAAGASTTAHIGAPGSTLRCGVISDLSFHADANLSSSTAVQVEPISGDTVVATELQNGIPVGSRLIQLHGVSSPNAYLNNLAFQRLRALFAGQTGYLVPAGPSDACQITSAGGGIGSLGQLFAPNGQNVSELLLTEGTLVPSSNGCEAEVLQGCYGALSQEAVSAKRITDFLWKPVSERNGSLAVLIDPSRVTVVVTGAVQEVLTDTGPSNGRGTTARSVARSGGGFGSGVTVEFFDVDGKRVLLNNGERQITIANGSERVRLFF